MGFLSINQQLKDNLKNSFTCQTFWGCCWNNVHKTHLKGAFGSNGFWARLFIHWIYLTLCAKGVWIYPKLNILSKVSVYIAINYLVDLFPNLWCNNSKATLFLGYIFFNLVFYFVFTKNSRFLCAPCGRVTTFSLLLTKYTMQKPFWNK